MIDVKIVSYIKGSQISMALPIRFTEGNIIKYLYGLGLDSVHIYNDKFQLETDRITLYTFFPGHT